MRIIRVSAYFLLSGFLLFALPAESAEAPFAINIAALRNIVTSGSKVKVKITLTNTSKHDITLVDTNRACDYFVEVRDGQGNLVPDTKRKQELRCGEGLVAGRNIMITLEPHESTEDEIAVSELSDITQPQKYSVQIQRQVPKQLGTGVIKSNRITITVTP